MLNYWIPNTLTLVENLFWSVGTNVIFGSSCHLTEPKFHFFSELKKVSNYRSIKNYKIKPKNFSSYFFLQNQNPSKKPKFRNNFPQISKFLFQNKKGNSLTFFKNFPRQIFSIFFFLENPIYLFLKFSRKFLIESDYQNS